MLSCSWMCRIRILVSLQTSAAAGCAAKGVWSMCRPQAVHAKQQRAVQHTWAMATKGAST